MEMVLTFILVSIILNTATGSRSIGHIAVVDSTRPSLAAAWKAV
jgi:hypothetical protein